MKIEHISAFSTRTMICFRVLNSFHLSSIRTECEHKSERVRILFVFAERDCSEHNELINKEQQKEI